jgi:hypothetical protein
MNLIGRLSCLAKRLLSVHVGASFAYLSMTDAKESPPKEDAINDLHTAIGVVPLQHEPGENVVQLLPSPTISPSDSEGSSMPSRHGAPAVVSQQSIDQAAEASLQLEGEKSGARAIDILVVRFRKKSYCNVGHCYASRCDSLAVRRRQGLIRLLQQLVTRADPPVKLPLSHLTCLRTG